MTKKRVFSGVQPTGQIHIGNWLGAINNWVNLQHEYETLVCVVDLHAITVPHNQKQLAEDTLSTAAMYMACGMDPNSCKIFIQSQVSAHTELCWYLNCITPLNWLERMIQFKEKSVKQGDNVSVGLLDYPVLMAADILLYDTDLVPVGEDQKQHLELARNIAQQRINSQYGNANSPILKVPEPLITKSSSRIMSLTDGNKKMSKSDENINSRICLLDSPEIIQKKIKRAKTDSYKGLEFDIKDRPEANNLLSIYYLLSGKTRDEVINECDQMGWGEFKKLLSEILIEKIQPIQQKYFTLRKDSALLTEVLSQGRTSAEEIAQKTLNKVKTTLGIIKN